MSQITQIVLITTGALRRQRKIVACVLVGGAALAALLFIGEGTSPSKAAPASAVGAGKARPGNGLIVFMRPGEIGAFDVWIVRPDGSHLRRVTKSPKGRDDHNPVWSPDGSTILFERRKLDSSTPGPDEAIYAVNANGKDLHQVTHCHGHCWSDSEPAWTADGSRIAFGRATGPRSAPAPSHVAIAVARADGSHVRRSPGRRAASRITIRRGRQMVARSCFSVTRAPRCLDLESSSPSMSPPESSAPSTSFRAGRQEREFPSSRQTARESCSASGASTVTSAQAPRASRATRSWPRSVPTDADCTVCRWPAWTRAPGHPTASRSPSAAALGPTSAHLRARVSLRTGSASPSSTAQGSNASPGHSCPCTRTGPPTTEIGRRMPAPAEPPPQQRGRGAASAYQWAAMLRSVNDRARPQT